MPAGRHLTTHEGTVSPEWKRAPIWNLATHPGNAWIEEIRTEERTRTGTPACSASLLLMMKTAVNLPDAECVGLSVSRGSTLVLAASGDVQCLELCHSAEFRNRKIVFVTKMERNCTKKGAAPFRLRSNRLRKLIVGAYRPALPFVVPAARGCPFLPEKSSSRVAHRQKPDAQPSPVPRRTCPPQS